METNTMGIVLVTALIENNYDVKRAEEGQIPEALIGYIPLELLDFVVDSKNQRLIGNPDHGGEFMIDMY
jgi:hypothetical protein